MNEKVYLENSTGATKLARKEVYDAVQTYLCFYRDSRAFTKYYKWEVPEIAKKARENWQDVMNKINANSLYFGTSLYKKYIAYANRLKELTANAEQGHYPVVKEWKERYSELAAFHDKAEVGDAVEGDYRFMDFFNELRIAANKEFLNDLIM